MMLKLRCPKPKARRVPARNAKWYGRLATSLVEPVHDHDRCILVEIPANDKRDQRVQHRPKRSWQFVSTRSKDGKALAATGDCVTLYQSSAPVCDREHSDLKFLCELRPGIHRTRFSALSPHFTRTEQDLVYTVCEKAMHIGDVQV